MLNTSINYLGLKPVKIIPENTLSYSLQEEDCNKLLQLPNNDITLTLPVLFSNYKVIIINPFEKEIDFVSALLAKPEFQKTTSPFLTLFQVESIWYWETLITNFLTLNQVNPVPVGPANTDQLAEGSTNLYLVSDYYKTNTIFTNTLTRVNSLITYYNSIVNTINDFNLLAATFNLAPISGNLPNITTINI